MRNNGKERRFTKLKKISCWLLILLVAFTLFGFFGAPPLLKSILVKQISVNLHRNASIDKIYINPFTLTARISGITIKEKGQKETFFSLDMLESSIDISVIKGNIVLDRLVLKRPYLHVVRHNDGSYNFSDILEKKEEAKSSAGAGKASKPVAFALHGINLQNGSVDFRDDPLNKVHRIRELNLTIPFISNIPRDIQTNVHPVLSLKINDAPYTIKGKTKPFADSHETTFDINMGNINVPFYMSYLPVKLPYRVSAGTLSIKANMVFIAYKDHNKEPSLALTGTVGLTDFSVHDMTDRPILSFPALNITLASVEPLVKKFHLAGLSLQSPRISLIRNKEGKLNVEPPASDEETKKKKQETRKGQTSQKPVKSDQDDTFRFIVDTVELNDGSVVLEDRSSPDTAHVSLDKMELRGSGISLDREKKGEFSLSLKINKKGTISADGSLTLRPLTVNTKVILKQIDIRPFQPYFADKVNITVTGGSIHGSGKLAVTESEKDGLGIRYNGEASVTKLASIDKESGDDILAMKSLFFKGIDFADKPTRLTVKGVAATDFDAHVAINEDGTINLQNIVVKDEPPIEKTTPAPAAEPAEKKKTASGDKEPPASVKINAVTLQGGIIHFVDSSVSPEYSTELTELGGRISNLSSDAKTMADVELRGKFDDYAPLEIVGKINPLRDDLYVDLKASFRDMDLSPVTPYSGKYAGYVIDKGKLSFNISYLIDKRKLDSKNDIFIDQLTFGQRVESPDATKLPVKLAVALLKDRQGRITLNIPVTGSLDDPKFSVWKIILKVLTNLLAKAATAPFALIGSLFGGGEELGYVEFDYGQSTLSEGNLKKIETLAKALQERTALRLDITGYADVERDKEGLKQYLLQKKVRARKLKDLAKKSTTDINVDDVRIDPQEYEKYLRLAYEAEKFPKPRNVIGFAKTIPVAEMEKLILTNTAIKNEDLRTLAAQRASKVREAILKSQGIDAGRVFIVEPKSLTPKKDEKLKESRVEFSLK